MQLIGTGKKINSERKHRYRMCIVWSILFIILISGNVSLAQTIRYVNSGATGNNTGLNWSNAYTSLESAIAAASSGTQIWVAAGTYKPSVMRGGATSRHQAFTLKDGVLLYGGFVGNESSLSQRNYKNNETILSGDIGIIGDQTDNCYHVVYVAPGTALGSSTLLDGFSVVYGNANGGSYPLWFGGGIYLYYLATPTIKNCQFKLNNSSSGGAVYIEKTNPVLDNCLFDNNTGGSLLSYLDANPTVTNSQFTNQLNSAAVSLNSSAITLINCLLVNNKSRGGSAITASNTSTVTLTNCTIANNNDNNYGAILCYSGGTITFNNTIIWGNYGNSSGFQVTLGGVNGVLNYSCYSSLDVFRTEGGATLNSTNNNTVGDPGFAGFSGQANYLLYSLMGTSPCVDRGNNAYNTEALDVRGSGYNRKINKSTGGSGVIDIGCYEYKPGSDLPEYTVVKSTNISQVEAKSGRLSFTYSSGGGQGRILFLKHATTGSAQPIYGRDYIADTTFMYGSVINGTDWYCIFIDTLSAPSKLINISGLEKGSSYLVQIIEFNKFMGKYYYFLSEELLAQSLLTTSNKKYFVKSNGSDSSIGITWNTSFRTIQRALESAEDTVEIWVGKGKFSPTKDDSGLQSPFSIFNITSNCSIIGGFLGTEDSISQRDLVNNKTIISGEIGNQFDSTDNINTLFRVDYLPEPVSLQLDGLILEKTYGTQGDGSIIEMAYNFLNINSCIIRNNYSNHSLIKSFDPYSFTVKNSQLINNITQMSIIEMNGGAIDMSNCVIAENLSSNCGVLINGEGNFTNCTIVNNHAINGAAIYLSGGIIDIANTIMFGNTASEHGNNIFIGGISFNAVGVYNSCVDLSGNNYYKQSEPDVELISNCISGNPSFIGSSKNAANPYLIYGNSICTDAGDNNFVVDENDIRGPGYKRRLSKLGNSSGTVDIGAYEYQYGIDLERRAPIYVKKTASGNNNGTSWLDAFNSIESALQDAEENDEIWVARGEYSASNEVGGTGSQYRAFVMKKDVKLLGGFAGNENAISERIVDSNITVLSAEQGNSTTLADNAYYIFRNNSILSEQTLIDGFVMTGARYSAMALVGGAHMTLRNIKFIWNGTGVTPGAGIYNTGAKLKIINSTFQNNWSSSGGAIFLTGTDSTILLNCLLANNEASIYGGAIYAEGILKITNCTIMNNAADSYGGGLMLWNPSRTEIANSIVWGNDAPLSRQIHLFNSATLSLRSSCYSNSMGDLNAQGSLTIGNDCISSDPMVCGTVNANHPFVPFGISPCIDAGNNSLIFEESDLRGGAFDRKLSKNTFASGIVDIGAYEYKLGADYFDGNVVLPVELSSLTGRVSGNSVVLQWETASEKNNHGFEIERKTNQKNWEKVGFVKGGGTVHSVTSYEFTEPVPYITGEIKYRLKQIDADGSFEYSDEVSVIANVPVSFALHQNYPNPFNPVTTIEYQIPTACKVSLMVYDLLGNCITELSSGYKEAGRYQVKFDAIKYAAGVYIYKLSAGSYTESKKLIVLK